MAPYRYVHLEVRCPAGSVAPNRTRRLANGQLVADFYLPSLFRHGYFHDHRRFPDRGTNPKWDEWQPLVTDGPELRFLDGVFGFGEVTNQTSAMLGRYFAREYLRRFLGFRWFADVARLQTEPRNGWGVSIPSVGDSPDWLVTRRGQAVIAEAKGTNRSTGPKKWDDWRTQVQNVTVTKDGVPRSLDTWIVMTRWTSTGKPNVAPQMVAEDPPLRGAAVERDDLDALELWCATEHVVEVLLNLGAFFLAAKLRAESSDRELMGTRAVKVYRCRLPRLRERRLIGGWIDPSTFWNGASPWSKSLMSHPMSRRLFLGIDVAIVGALLHSTLPDELSTSEDRDEEALNDFVSFHEDGTIVSPEELIEPTREVLAL